MATESGYQEGPVPPHTLEHLSPVDPSKEHDAFLSEIRERLGIPEKIDGFQAQIFVRERGLHPREINLNLSYRDRHGGMVRFSLETQSSVLEKDWFGYSSPEGYWKGHRDNNGSWVETRLLRSGEEVDGIDDFIILGEEIASVLALPTFLNALSSANHFTDDAGLLVLAGIRRFGNEEWVHQFAFSPGSYRPVRLVIFPPIDSRFFSKPLFDEDAQRTRHALLQEDGSIIIDFSNPQDFDGIILPATFTVRGNNEEIEEVIIEVHHLAWKVPPKQDYFMFPGELPE